MMIRRLLLASALTAGSLALAGAALAKGPSQATIQGAGIHPITLKGFGEPGSGTPLGGLVDQSGYFPAVFGQSPDPMQAHRPTGSLGPKYRVTYKVPGPDTTDSIRQDLYPYAQPRPVAYLAPGQRFFGSQQTRGGWYSATSELKRTLVAAGLPRQAPSSADGGSGFPRFAWITLAIAAGLALLLGASATVRATRRRQGTAEAV